MPVARTCCRRSKPQTTTADVEEELLRRERRRRQCRVSQRRYRDKQGSTEYNLKLDVNSLREHGMRELLETKMWSTRLAREGPWSRPSSSTTLSSHTGCITPKPAATTFASASTCKWVSSRPSWIRTWSSATRAASRSTQSWHLYTLFHATLSVRMLSAEVCGTEDVPIVVVKGVLAVRMNRSSIENMFPHIVANEELVQVLLGREIEYPTSTTSCFNSCSRVERQDIIVDFLAVSTAAWAARTPLACHAARTHLGLL
ncbi:hypothetical protein GQ600_2796 [Phytophthora cactorum]|nr:hypothetical protein GQ600_2796 [Phytophthora cactorum]